MTTEIHEPKGFLERIAAFAPQTRTNVSQFEIAPTISGLLRRMDHVAMTPKGKVRKARGRIQTMGNHVKVYWNSKGECFREEDKTSFPQGDLMLKGEEL